MTVNQKQAALNKDTKLNDLFTQLVSLGFYDDTIIDDETTQNNIKSANSLNYRKTELLLASYLHFVYASTRCADDVNEILQRVVRKINEAVEDIQYYPRKGKILSKTICLRYLDSEYVSIEDVCNKMNVSHATFFNYRKAAIKLLSYRLFD